MNARIEHYRNSLKSKGFGFCLKEASKALFPLRIVRDKGLTDALFQKRASRYLRRRYLPLLGGFIPEPEAEGSKIIWTCWLQGEENAPELVRKCIESVRRFSNGYEVKLITWENISEYVEVPEYICRRLQKKQMQYAQFSDYLRVALLCRWGGVWMDSTAMLTAPIPEKILREPLFVLKTSAFDEGVIRNSSWFICACRSERILQQTKYLLECYWKKERRLCDYFLFHLLMALVSDRDEKNRKRWTDMPFVGNANAHRMQAMLFKPYTDKLYDSICEGSFIHKLTYKFTNPELVREEGTLYSHIVR